MNFFSRLFAKQTDPRDRLRPLWHAIVRLSREPRWYAELGVADTVPGRFDMISSLTALALLRMENDPELAGDTAALTELFIDDMDGQLRESGVGDVVVGKHVGRIMSVLGGRLGAYRDGLVQSDDGALTEAVQRNVHLLEGADPAPLAKALRATHGRFAALEPQALIAGDLG